MADPEDKKKAKEDKKAEKLAKKEAKKNKNLTKEEDKNTDDTANENEAQKSDKETSGSGILQWIIMAVVVLVCVGAGFGLGRLFAGYGQPQSPLPSQQTEPAPIPPAQKTAEDVPAENSKGIWYYNDLEPVAANLNVPNATRYVRVTLTLEISSDLAEEQGRKLLDAKKPALKNRLTLYLASLSIKDCTGTKNLMRIRSEILDAFNQELFPDSKPQIRKIYLKEFVIQ